MGERTEQDQEQKELAVVIEAVDMAVAMVRTAREEVGVTVA